MTESGHPDPHRTVARRASSDTPPTVGDGRLPLTEDADDGEKTHAEGAVKLVGAPGLPLVPGYVVTREIARGGMGVVYAAHDPTFEREVAIKVMHARQNPSRFVIEAKVTAQLPHPGVPPVHALGTLPDGRPFLAMKLIQGRTLADELEAPSSGVTRAESDDIARGNDRLRMLGVFEAICQTVGFAHAKGIVHRDLKPSNVMVGHFGEVLVMDWGLAKSAESRAEIVGNRETFAAIRRGGRAGIETTVGAVKGTPAYMAPEQARGEPVDCRADVFALGGILAVILTDNPPFLGDTVMDTVLKAARAELAECFDELDDCGADAELVAIAKRALAARSECRYADGRAVAAAIAAYRAGVAERLHDTELAYVAAEARAEEEVNTRREAEARAVEGRKRKRLQLAAITVLAVFAVVGVGGWQWYERRAERTATRLKAETEAEARAKSDQALRGIDSGLKLAADLRKQYKYADAATALAQALELAHSGAPERVAEVENAQDDVRLAIQLDDIRYRKWLWVVEGTDRSAFDLGTVAPLYRKAFAERGLDVATLPPNEVARRVAASDVKVEMLAALDECALYEKSVVDRDRILAVTKRIDPTPWRDRLRDPANWEKKEVVAALAADVDPATESPVSLSLLAFLMRRYDLNPVPILSLARAHHPSDFELAFVLGQLLRNNRERGTALFEAARALRPTNVSVLNNLAVLLTDAGRYDEGIATLRLAVQLDPKHVRAHHNLTYVLRLSGRLDEAEAQCLKTIALDANFALPRNTLGVLRTDRGKFEEAIVEFRKATEIDPKCTTAYVNAGTALQSRGRHAEAVIEFKNAIALGDAEPRAYVNLGFSYDKMGKREDALKAYLECTRVYPRHANGHYNVAYAKQSNNDFLGAIASYRVAARLNPRDLTTQVNLALLLEQVGKPHEAISVYYAALEIDRRCVEALCGLGNALAATDDPKGAADAYRAAIEINPKFVSARTELGILLVQQGQLTEAVEHLRVAVRLRDRDPLLHENLGTALLREGEADEAVAEFRVVVNLAPRYARGRYKLADALEQSGDLIASVAEYQEAIRLSQKSPLLHSELGRIYVRLKRYGDADASARAAIKLDAKFADAHAVLASALLGAGDRAGARAAQAEAARLDKRFPTEPRLPLEVAPPPRPVKMP